MFGSGDNALKLQDLNFNFDEIFTNVRYVELDKVAKLSKISINESDMMFIKFEITDTLLKPYTSPIIVYLKNGDKIVSSGIYTSSRMLKNCNSSGEIIEIDVKKLKPMKYEVTYGLFHQGSLNEYNQPLFFIKKEQIEIK